VGGGGVGGGGGWGWREGVERIWFFCPQNSIIICVGVRVCSVRSVCTRNGGPEAVGVGVMYLFIFIFMDLNQSKTDCYFVLGTGGSGAKEMPFCTHPSFTFRDHSAAQGSGVLEYCVCICSGKMTRDSSNLNLISSICASVCANPSFLQ